MINKDNVRGFALAPPALGDTDDQPTAINALRPPCRKSCQILLKQLNPSWQWWESFPIDLDPPWHSDYARAFFKDGMYDAPSSTGSQAMAI